MMEAIEALSTDPPKLRSEGVLAPGIPGPSTPLANQQKESREEHRRDEENVGKNVIGGTSRLKILLVEGPKTKSCGLTV